MRIKYYSLLIFLAGTCLQGITQNKDLWNRFIGTAYLETRGYEVLGKICDQVGPRLMGSANFNNAQDILKKELLIEGLNPVEESFNTLGWVRGKDEVLMIQPTSRKLKATALGYVNSTPTFKANVIFAGNGSDEEFKKIDARGKIALVAREGNFGRSGPSTRELINSAMANGVKALLFYNSEQPGFLAIARTGSFQEDTVRIPVFNMTYEEGSWLKRLCDQKIPAELQITTLSYCQQIHVKNLIVALRGKVKDKIVIGAHFDSWDLGQGAADNGIGTAILFEIAHLIKKINPMNYYTVEFVWFTGEELGLVGSKHYVQMHKNDKIITYINFDMTGYPVGFNTMGFDEYIPILEDITKKLDGFDMKDGVKSNPGTGSDHISFMLAGIPSLEISGHLDEIQYKFYHEGGDTYDKINKKYISETAGVASIMIYELANNMEIKHKNRTETEMVELLKKYKLDEQLKKTGEWKYKD